MTSQELVVTDNNDNWPNVGPQNPEDVRVYQDRINKIFDEFAVLWKEDR